MNICELKTMSRFCDSMAVEGQVFEGNRKIKAVGDVRSLF